MIKKSFISIDQGYLEQVKGQYPSLEQQFESENDTVALIVLCMGFGQIYRLEQKPDSAMKYFYKGLSLAERSKDTDYEASIRNNIAGVYQELNKSELAEKEFIKAKESALNPCCYKFTLKNRFSVVYRFCYWVVKNMPMTIPKSCNIF